MPSTRTETIGTICRPCLPKTVDVPVELYKSLQGEYFIGSSDDLVFGQGTGAWARLMNPIGSGVNLFVNVWTVTDNSDRPIRAEFWFNADAPGTPEPPLPVTPSNTALTPLPEPLVLLQQAQQVPGTPSGIKAFERRCPPNTTLAETENGKLIFPPGGSFLVFLSIPEYPDELVSGRVAFGWWEERVCFCGA